MRFAPAALAMVIAVLPVRAHHPITQFFDASKPGSVTGTVVEFRVQNPHVVLIVEGMGPDGRSGRWAFEGQSPNAFRAQGVRNIRTRLVPGMRVTVSGWPAKDPSVPVFAGREVTFADGSTLLFGPTPGDGEWRCLSEPCYRYPDVSTSAR